ncbi:substrate-binding domain-containing protein [Bacillus sp. F19]|nr:substrate-binding domain-containing protein [Bacillus sp. F19]
MPMPVSAQGWPWLHHQVHLAAQGYTVPTDVGIGSFDNGHLSQITNPKIKMMDIDLYLFGKKAFEQLFWRMDNKEEPFKMSLLLFCEVV